MSLTLLWPILVVYGAVMFLVSPTARRFGEFFSSRTADGRDVGAGMLVSSVVISWIFAKSITNASNLGASYGVVGAVSYAGWYLSIPVAGVVIYAIRRKLGAESLAGFLTSKYGHAAALGFMLVILLRLVNEVWSNTAVVGAYFGASGTPAYFSAAMVFALMTLFYSLRGGLRSSIFTDAIQFGVGVFLLVFVLALVVPRSGAVPLIHSGQWTLKGGVDLLLVAILQSFSYPFHDPVLTDRGFITRPGIMLRSYLLSGFIAGSFIVLFGLVGVYAKQSGIDVGQDAPLRVAQAFGVGMLSMMSVLMMVSAGSTLDSTLSSVSRAVVVDMGGRSEAGSNGHPLLRRAARHLAGTDPIRIGRIAMIAAVIVGSLPLLAGAAILKATTVSGTMVLGLAPPFLLFAWARAKNWAFHMGFWPGIVVGILYAAGHVPAAWTLGDGPYAVLLGANVWGTVVTFGGFALGAWLDGLSHGRRLAAAGAGVGMLLLFGLPSLIHAETVTAPATEDASPLEFGGQTMFRLTFNRNDAKRPSAEIYNLRLTAAKDAAPFRYFAEIRFRQTPLRTFSPSNVWLQQAYVTWASPAGGLTVSAGLIYDQLGLFWDGSWFGNLSYLNGHKLDPDMNLELKMKNDAIETRLGYTVWIQVSPQGDGLNGSYMTVNKQAAVVLPVDLETAPGFREGPGVRARVVPRIRIGDAEISPGGSIERTTYDRSDSVSVTGSETMGGGELTIRWRRFHVFGEYQRESIVGLGTPDLTRDYLLGGAELRLLQRDAPYFPEVSTGISIQQTDYDPENFHETFLTARVFGKVHRSVGVTAEYVRWEIADLPDPELDRFEFILHVYY